MNAGRNNLQTGPQGSSGVNAMVDIVSVLSRNGLPGPTGCSRERENSGKKSSAKFVATIIFPTADEHQPKVCQKAKEISQSTELFLFFALVTRKQRKRTWVCGNMRAVHVLLFSETQNEDRKKKNPACSTKNLAFCFVLFFT